MYNNVPHFEDSTEIAEVNKKKLGSTNLAKLANYWITDKGTEHGCQHNYVRYYEKHFSHLKNIPTTQLLEIGIARGSSLKCWSEYFNPRATIYGLDINEKCLNCCGDNQWKNINLLIGNATTYNFPNSSLSVSPLFDIIIDDGSHLADDIEKNFHNMIKYLKLDGIYVIEDMLTCANADYIANFYKYEHRSQERETLEEYINKNHHNRLITFIETLKKTSEYQIDMYEDKICFITRKQKTQKKVKHSFAF